MQHADIRRLENLAANAWPAEAVEILGGWTMQFDHGVTRRANSVLPTGWSGELSLDDAVAAVERRYPAHSLRPCYKITDAALPAGLDDRLGDRGYRREGHSLVLAAPLSAVNARARSPAEIELLDTTVPAWRDACWPGTGSDAGVAPRIGIVGRIRPPHVFALARRDGQPAGAALAVVEQGWACITAVHTVADHRRQGVAQSLLAAVIDWARGRMAEFLYLQVEADNRPAQRLYAVMGFSPAYRYHYRLPASADDAS